MDNAIRFFLDHWRLNYTLAFFLLCAGIYSYITLPKEIFPPIELDKVIVNGWYPGASADNLDKMAVADLEEEIQSIAGVNKVNSTIRNGEFSILAELDTSADKIDILSKVKDAISQVRPDLPSDMDEPTAQVLVAKIPLMQVAVSSDDLSSEELLSVAKEIESRIARIPNLTDVTVYGDADREIKIRIDSRKIKAYGLSKESVSNAIANLSYIFPLGKIEEQGRHIYLSTTYGKEDEPDYLSTRLSVDGKRIFLGDIATVAIEPADQVTRSTFDASPAFTMNIAKDKEGNAIDLSKQIKQLLTSFEKDFPGVVIKSFSDTSIYIENRLNTVLSNIFFGFVLVTISLFLLINYRISIVVAVGIPFAFIIALIAFQFTGFSVNMTSLLGALIAIGVLVDDAIIVAENIQRHIEEGKPPREAAIVGTREVASPVLMATITTMFAFLPMLIISGEMGEWIKMIPIAIIILVAASLIECFFFLPIHCRHLLKNSTPTRSWARGNDAYIKLIRWMVRRKRLMLFFFLVFIPVAAFIGFSHSKFQLLLKFDATDVYITGKLPVDNSVDDTYATMRKIEDDIRSLQDEAFLLHTSGVAGFLFDQKEGGDLGERYFSFFIPLKDPVHENFIEAYIQPVLTLDFEQKERVRTLKSFEIETLLREKLSFVKEKYGLEEFSIDAAGAGIVEWDIDIAMASRDDAKITHAITTLRAALENTEGVIKISDDAKLGISELKIKINPYGEQLGFSEARIALVISDYFLFAPQANSFDSSGIVEIRTEDISKDRLQTLKDFVLTDTAGQSVRLDEIADFTMVKAYEKIVKTDGEREKSIFANVDANIITPAEVLAALDPTLKEMEKQGVTIKLGGEQEQIQQLKIEASVAFVISLFMMFLSLLLLFDSFKSTLMILSIIPFSLLGVTLGHHLMGINLTLPSIIGILGLAGVVINDGIVMLNFIKNTTNPEELFVRASKRLRPVLLTSITTLLGLSTLIFFPSGQAKVMQPLAISLGFGLAWGTILNLLYLPTLYAVVNRIRAVPEDNEQNRN